MAIITRSSMRVKPKRASFVCLQDKNFWELLNILFYFILLKKFKQSFKRTSINNIPLFCPTPPCLGNSKRRFAPKTPSVSYVSCFQQPPIFPPREDTQSSRPLLCKFGIAYLKYLNNLPRDCVLIISFFSAQPLLAWAIPNFIYLSWFF